MTNDEVNKIIAEWMGERGYNPVGKCQHGHTNDYKQVVGGWCPTCIVGIQDFKYLNAHAFDLSEHPEWRIQRGEPLDFCSSLDLTVAAMDGRLCFGLTTDWNGHASAAASIYGKDDHQGLDTYGYHEAKTSSDALAHALAEAIVKMQEMETQPK